MKLHLNIERDLPLFTGYGEDHVLINGTRHDRSLFLNRKGIYAAPWADLDFEALTAAHFHWIAEHPAEIVLFGSGHRLRFPHPSLTRALVEARIGLEVMDIGAMCRTYNILVGEGRSVAAAVLIEPVYETGNH
ncbi:MAG: Mth938-like domain-containing protein [Thiobacillaceae bacterium]